MTNDDPTTSATWGRVLALIGSPIALTTALLFYFGWVRTRFQARVLGYDPSILDLSLQEYLLKSINVLFLPLVVLVLGVLLLEQGHRRLISAAGQRPGLRAAAVRSGRLLVISWPLWVGVAAALLAVPYTRIVAIPASLTAATLLALYGHQLTRQLDAASGWTPLTTVLIFVLLALALFWDTERVARSTGEAYAHDILAFPQQLIPVAVFSEKRMGMGSPDVNESALRPDSAYSFCYSGLLLLEGGHDRFVLLTQNGDRVLLLRTLDSLRFEFGPNANCGHN